MRDEAWIEAGKRTILRQFLLMCDTEVVEVSKILPSLSGT